MTKTASFDKAIRLTALLILLSLFITLAVGCDGQEDDGIHGEGGGSYSEGDTFYADGASLTYLGQNSGKYSFTLNITSKQERIDVILYGQGTDSYGNPISVISTTAPFAELTHIVISPPTLTVNGRSVNEIPVLPGEYSVTVDFSGIDMSKYLMRNYFAVYPFGNIFR